MRSAATYFLRARLLGAIVLLANLLFSCGGLNVSRYYENGAIATASSAARDIGIGVFQKGGNAFDAAVAVGFALAVTNPQTSSLGGGGFAAVRIANTDSVRILDFAESFAADDNSAYNSSDSLNPDNDGLNFSARAAGVPGTVAGLHALWSEYGSLPWDDLVRPAAELADAGALVDSTLSAALVEHVDLITRFPATARVYFPDGHPPAQGDQLIQSELAATMFAIAQEGPEPFYHGRVAALIDSTMRQYGSLITQRDLAEYRPIWREPLRVRFDSLDIYTVGSYFSGGITIGRILKLLKPFNIARFGPDSPQFIHLFTRASELAFANRFVYQSNPVFDNANARLLDSVYNELLIDNIDTTHTGSSNQSFPESSSFSDRDEAANFSVCDIEGNMVAISTTLGSAFGSGIMVERAGFFLNNAVAMSRFFWTASANPEPDSTVLPSVTNIELGRRVSIPSSPMIVLIDGRPSLVPVSSGGSTIISSATQAILLFSRFSLSPHEIIEHSLVHYQREQGVLLIEKGKHSTSTIQALIRYGHKINESCSPTDLQLIHIEQSGLMMVDADALSSGILSGY